MLDDNEKKRLRKLTFHERKARRNGFLHIAGVDEAGRGPLAGPVFAAACIIPHNVWIEGVNDSKKLLPEKRREIFQRLIADTRILYGIGRVDPNEIDVINILQASLKAMQLAIAALAIQPDYLLIDGPHCPQSTIPAQGLIDGDALSQSIAAASIIAKESRDAVMVEYHEQWPQYGFDRHKGYSTPQHLTALEQHGPCPLHRLSFSPLRQG